MGDTYKIYTPNGLLLNVNKQSNEIYFLEGTKETGKYTKSYSKALLEAWKIMESSPYKNYKPIYLCPTLRTGESSTLLEFKAWQELYLKEPIKGKIAPWTKKEKAYYESLRTKNERYKYLVIRSGLQSAIIDIPYEAYACYEDKEKFEKYEHIFYEVEKNRGLTHLSDGYLFMAEWELAAGILGDINGFFNYDRLHGFKARLRQVEFLALQLSGGKYEKNSIAMSYDFKHYADRFEFGLDGMHKNPLRAQMIKQFAKNPPYDSFEMLPYLDEMMGVDWVMDFNNFEEFPDNKGKLLNYLYEKVKKGELKDPRDKDSTPESRREFLKDAYGTLNGNLEPYDLDIPNDWSEEEAKLYINTLLLEAKLFALTPPQGYPNAPDYYIFEHIEDIYQEGNLDKKLNPTIPAIYRENFPKWLRNEIDSYARKHHIRD